MFVLYRITDRHCLFCRAAGLNAARVIWTNGSIDSRVMSSTLRAGDAFNRPRSKKRRTLFSLTLSR